MPRCTARRGPRASASRWRAPGTGWPGRSPARSPACARTVGTGRPWVAGTRPTWPRCRRSRPTTHLPSRSSRRSPTGRGSPRTWHPAPPPAPMSARQVTEHSRGAAPHEPAGDGGALRLAEHSQQPDAASGDLDRARRDDDRLPRRARRRTPSRPSARSRRPTAARAGEPATGVGPACSSSRNESSTIGSPRRSRCRSPRPSRYMPMVRSPGRTSRRSVSSRPAGWNQARSLQPSPPGTSRPSKNAGWRSTGCSAAARAAAGSNASRSSPRRRGVQSTQEISLSWQ